MVKNIGFLVFQGMAPLDFIGPWDVLTSWTMLLEGAVNCLKFGITTETVSSFNNISFTPDHDIDNVPPLSVIVIPGAIQVGEVTRNKDFIKKLTMLVEKADQVLTICTGSFILEATGLLRGRAATTHWSGLAQLKEAGVNVKESRVVQDGKFWSGGGVTSGIDLALAFINNQAGKEIAGLVQLSMEYFPSKEVYASKSQVEKLPPMCAYDGVGKGKAPSGLPEYILKNHIKE